MADEGKKTATPPPSGVEEKRVPYQALADDDWSIERARLAEYRRTGETISVEEFMAELDREVERIRAQKA